MYKNEDEKRAKNASKWPVFLQASFCCALAHILVANDTNFGTFWSPKIGFHLRSKSQWPTDDDNLLLTRRLYGGHLSVIFGTKITVARGTFEHLGHDVQNVPL